MGLARAVAGALLFALPLYMTVEMWWLGFSMNRWRLALFTLVTVALLVGVAYYRGLDDRLNLREAVIDAFLGYGVGVIVGALFLYLVGVIETSMSADEVVVTLRVENRGETTAAGVNVEGALLESALLAKILKVCQVLQAAGRALVRLQAFQIDEVDRKPVHVRRHTRRPALRKRDAVNLCDDVNPRRRVAELNHTVCH
jgi:uncharacterized membrane protein